LQVTDDAGAATLRAAFETVPGLVPLVLEHELADAKDDALVVGACELVLEALVARRKISRNEQGHYGRMREEGRRRRSGGEEPFGGLSA
jgi:magnesium chelatase subunit I